MPPEAPAKPARDGRAPSSGPVNVLAVPPAAAGSVAWRMGGQLRLTVVVKATFAFVADAPMTPGVPDELVRAELHHQNNPMRSVRLTSDLAPYLPGANVLLTGHGCAPRGERTSALMVRLAVFRGQPLLDKSILVRGDPQGAGQAPFERIPLVYERAYGGVGWEDNPFGVGFRAEAGKAPNLVSPDDPKAVACFGPIARGWPARKRLLGTADRKALDRPVAEVPAGFDWTYYHAAPADQRAGYLQGDEWVVLEGLHPAVQMVRSRLPDARAVALVHGLDGGAAGQPMVLVADTLRIDGDTLTCSLVWRGSVPVPDEAALGAVRVLAGVETLGQPVVWPAPPVDARPGPPPAAPTPELRRPAHTGTITLQDDPAVEDVTDLAATFHGPVELRGDEQLGSTVSLDRGAHGAAEHAAEPLPFRAGPPAVATLPAPPAPRIDESPFTGTMVLAGDEEPETSPSTLPFGEKAGAAAPARQGSPRPAAGRPAAGPVVPSGRADTVELRPAAAPAPARAVPPPTSGEEPTRALPDLPPDLARAALLADLGLPAPASPAVPFRAPPPEPPRVPPPSAPRALPPETLRVPPPEAPHVPPPEAPRVPPPMLGKEARPVGPAPQVARGLRLAGDSGLAFAVVPWGPRAARACLAVIAKATCDLVPGGPAALRAAAEPLSREVQADGERGTFCLYPSDFAPFKVRADVVAVGQAVAGKTPVPRMEVTLRLGEGEGALDRTLVVHGDRRWVKAAAGLKPSAPEPFSRLPLRHERAFGGPRFLANPSGTGHRDRLRPALGLLPNLEDPEALLRTPNQTPAPACFAPIPMAWKEAWAEVAGRNEASLPEAFDWTRHQIAPRAQQLAFLRGDEPFALVGMSAQHPSLEGTLPGVRPRCFAVWPPGARVRFEEIALRLDTVVLDADQMTLSLVWRGVLPVLDESAPPDGVLHLLTEPLAAPEAPLADVRAKLLRG